MVRLEERDCTFCPIGAICAAKLRDQRKATESSTGMKLQIAWKSQFTLEISVSSSESCPSLREKRNLRPPRFVATVTTSCQNANKSSKDESSFSASRRRIGNYFNRSDNGNKKLSGENGIPLEIFKSCLSALPIALSKLFPYI